MLLAGGPGVAQPRVDLDVIAPLPNDAPIAYFIDEARADSGARPGDGELCGWALEDWVRHADGRISVTPAAEAEARVRIYFVSSRLDAPGRTRYG